MAKWRTKNLDSFVGDRPILPVAKTQQTMIFSTAPRTISAQLKLNKVEKYVSRSLLNVFSWCK